jgi:hypothetical protein
MHVASIVEEALSYNFLGEGLAPIGAGNIPGSAQDDVHLQAGEGEYSERMFGHPCDWPPPANKIRGRCPNPFGSRQKNTQGMRWVFQFSAISTQARGFCPNLNLQPPGLQVDRQT